MSKIVDFFVQNARTIGIVYVVGAVVVFLAMTAFYIWVDRASKKEQELYYDEYYYPDDEFAESMVHSFIGMCDFMGRYSVTDLRVDCVHRT